MDTIKDEIIMKLEKTNALLEIFDYKAVLELCEDVLSQSEIIQYMNGEIEALQIMGTVYFNKADYGKAFELAIKVSKLLEEQNEMDQVFENYNSFAKLFIRHKDYFDAIELLKKGLKTAIKVNNHRQEVVMSNLMGYAFSAMGQYDVAEEILDNALDIAQKNNHVQHIPDIKMNLTKLYILVGSYDQAKHYLDDTMIEVEILKNYEQIIHGNLLYAHIAYERKDYEATRHFSKKAENLAKSFEFNFELAAAYEWLHLACSGQKNFEEAYIHLLKYVDISEKIVNNEKEKSLARMRIKYDLYQKEKETEILRNKNEKIKKQRQELEYLMDVLGRQNEELHSIAIKDYLTGTYNRKFFMMKFEEEFSIADEYNKDMACLVFDVDKFKAINDTYGHLAGDEVIKHIVDQSTFWMGEQAIIGRFGGDEFIILLLGADINQAVDIGEKILQSIRSSYVSVGDVNIYSTISIGVADNKTGNSTNAEDMIRLADRALYKAKENGRDQLSIAFEE